MQVWQLKDILSRLDDADETMEVFVGGEGGFTGDTGAWVDQMVDEDVRFYGKFTGRALVIA